MRTTSSATAFSSSRETRRDPFDDELTNLVGELSTRCEYFRTRWAAHNVRLHRRGVKHLHHPVVGDLELTYAGMELPSDPGLMLFAYTAQPGTPSDDGLKLLASWAATRELGDAAASTSSVNRPAH
ncbi:MmyB family transcriptional regulator [Mycolicibacterium stellerae]|uniref:MmyB family transcriptional regulator n=1 Tax=Mycolicibacterium stellerae TaxID=2358193 RepID=UPI001F2884D3|nr:DNA-binding protein [Mycolicibacterium stellerae]